MSERVQQILVAGVSQEHVNLMENIYPLPLPDLSLYDELENEQAEVPLDKVKGGYRIDSTLSWSENFHIMKEKIDHLLNSIEEDGLQQYVESFLTSETTSPIELGYCDNLDSYFVISDGNHRITVAKMIGMKTIRAKVCFHKFIKDRADLKSNFICKREKLKEKIETLGFWHECKNRDNVNEINIYFRDQHIAFFIIPNEYRFSEGDINKALQFLNNLEKLIERYRSLPIIVRSIFLLYIKNADQNYKSIVENEFASLLQAGYFKQ
ncbi:ParB/Srx family N-terminal domain-containing protein [Bacillus atrophaeus]|uniref:ParB/Srx family N-terminal domain-containing protein n=1 Tax=Bacillus atrophaeus TaxID=1452 RepID=UPI00227DD2E4|nr:ParB/Srx family N-terminal domain-containing protein [Bacillus atrophaeus]MCY8466503.1 ParB/Srx family N-terminal domain-containing protein [Bacillus atrophaeus]MCY8478962.1 ParB/Srx family N-terminal domain-containing protein [Bacillus atrophaeus]